MRTIRWSGQFKRDYKRELRGKHRGTVDDDLRAVLDILAQDRPLPPKCRDHPLLGEWRDFRDCHIYSDLLLIYRKTGKNILDLARLGSHSELGF
jgi:mRNA interferase YafQ